ncbi:hypothetical protein NC651_011609 [Populus alba x Populus x berolinensis]|nr:hypothetical protein NC651_011609 [Populus alba x Populus x berolinensis]
MASCALQGLVKRISEVNMDHSTTNVVVRLLLLARLSEDQTLQDKEAFCREHNHHLMELGAQARHLILPVMPSSPIDCRALSIITPCGD